MPSLLPLRTEHTKGPREQNSPLLTLGCSAHPRTCPECSLTREQRPWRLVFLPGHTQRHTEPQCHPVLPTCQVRRGLRGNMGHTLETGSSGWGLGGGQSLLLACQCPATLTRSPPGPWKESEGTLFTDGPFVPGARGHGEAPLAAELDSDGSRGLGYIGRSPQRTDQTPSTPQPTSFPSSTLPTCDTGSPCPSVLLTLGRLPAQLGAGEQGLPGL